jgi:hypothetical protein
VCLAPQVSGLELQWLGHLYLVEKTRLGNESMTQPRTMIQCETLAALSCAALSCLTIGSREAQSGHKKCKKLPMMNLTLYQLVSVTVLSPRDPSFAHTPTIRANCTVLRLGVVNGWPSEVSASPSGAAPEYM